MVPKTGLEENIKGTIDIKVQCKTNPIFHGEALNSGVQDYAITYKPYFSPPDTSLRGHKFPHEYPQ